MKKIFFLASAMVPALLFAQTPSYNITVKLPRAKAGTHAWLVESFGWSNQRILDSAVFNKGIVVFKGATGNAIKAHIVINHAGPQIPISDKQADALLVYLDSTAMTIAGKDSVQHAVVTGSLLNKEYIGYYQQVLAPSEKVGEAINTAYRKATPTQQGSAAYRDSLMAYIKQSWEQRDSLKKVYIRQHPNSFLSLEALTEVGGKDIDVPVIEPVFAKLSPAVRNTRLGVSFAKKLYDKGATSIGEMAPDFAQPDAQGKLVKLSDYKGQYVLIDFWASWCGPCRAENPNVLKAYHAFKDKSFTVLGVSLDETSKRDAWLKAIEKDALPWTQVSDLKGWQNEAAVLYSVQAIPQNYLIDPTGKIVAKNLRGAALEAKLQEILGK